MTRKDENYTSFEEAAFLFQEGMIIFTPCYDFHEKPYFDWVWRPNEGSELKFRGLYMPEGLTLRNVRHTVEFAIRNQP